MIIFRTLPKLMKNFCLGVMFLVLTYFVLVGELNKREAKIKISGEPFVYDIGELSPFIIIVCNELNASQTSSFRRQKEQITVLLKSAASLTKTVLRFLVVTDTEDSYNEVVSIPETWPKNFQRRIVMERRTVWYPPDREQMKNLLRPCSSARLFLPEILTDLDSAILVDTDALFLSPPEELLTKIYHFDDKQAVGVAQTSSGYDFLHRMIPYVKPRGANTGVMVMNLTRLRSLPGGWTGTTLNAFDTFRKRIGGTATNDIVNIALALNPDLVYTLSCVWNYGPGACWRGENTCQESEVMGCSLLHGTSAAFVSRKNPKFKAVYEAWKDHEMGSPLSTLLDSIKWRIEADNSAAVRCNALENLDFMFTQALERLV
ncbi:Glucoside xylosyltransferase 2 [Halocaridina rubra]|uniref:Glucoside xylosyltransferase 2 n=1 Tax=Halocaridina rubra TaxID=373956 RepID=A0AAN8XDB2_HALRR